MDLSTTSNRLRVAIIGSGPSAFYTAEHLQKQKEVEVEIDMFERLPTPYGLVRGGVAPDHGKIKTVTKAYDRTAARPSFRFFGNVTYGVDITHQDLLRHYHAVVYAVGAQTDRRLGIPGEDLPGSHAATEFVGWYNGHPDYRDLTFDLSQERVAVIGNGNVAMDVVRILARAPEELRATDIADYALEALEHSQVREILVLGRRGPVQTKFTHAELKELGELPNADIIVEPAELELDPLSQAYLESGDNPAAERNHATLRSFSEKLPEGKPRRIIVRFLVSPVEILGADHVQVLRVVKNEICERGHFLRPCPTDEFETIPVGLIFRSIGYRGVPLPDVPFDEKQGVISSVVGRVVHASGDLRRGEYCVGWIKRGPSGIIGTNKPDAAETVERILEDVRDGKVNQPAHPAPESVETMLRERGIRYVTFEDWQILDQLEIERGEAVGRPRLKFSRVVDMLEALEQRKRALTQAPISATAAD